MFELLLGLGAFILIIFLVGGVLTFISCFQKVEQGTALIKTGMGKTRVSFSGMVILPVIHRKEIMDISLKRIEIYRHGAEGLICKDNVRADIKVAFFVRVNNSASDVLTVAQSIGCKRASDRDAMIELFDAKFSEALKTVGKNFDFTDLYTERNQFKDAIVAHIGTDLNGYVLDDAAIDFLEQTDVTKLDANNILDAEGIKKITDLTAKEAVLANEINREKQKVIKKQDVEAREAILELERQQADAEAKQAREIATVQAREEAEAQKVMEEERFKSEKARISTEEELGVAEENKLRQILVAERAKQRTDAVETERVERERGLETIERERLVELSRIEKDKALEVELKKIQDVIRERVTVERAVEEEQQKIKDTQEVMTAERAKTVQLLAAEANAEQEKLTEVKKAEAGKVASQFEADEMLIEAEAKRESAEKEALGKIKLAEAIRAETAAAGLAEAEVMEAKAGAIRDYGTAESEVIAKKGNAEAEVIASVGESEALATQKRYDAEAQGTAAKAEAMKKLDGVGKEHEEFKLRLNKDKEIEIAAIDVQKDIAEQQATVLGEALKQANIDIVGGDGQFFDRIINSITAGKQVDRLVGNSDNLQVVRDTFFDEDPSANGDGKGGDFGSRVKKFMSQLDMDSEDVKNLSIAALLGKMIAESSDDGVTGELKKLLKAAKSMGMADTPASKVRDSLKGGL